MPLSNIATVPSDQTQGLFDFSHQQDHADIIAAIYAAKGVNLPVRAIFPNLGQGPGWKQLHQAMHDEANSALGTQGQNLRGEIDDTWYDQNYLEHQAWHQVLGV